MPFIRPIRDLKDTSKISDLAHSAREPIFSSEIYDRLMDFNRIDYAIFEAEQEMNHGAEAALAESVFDQLEEKYFG